jgi:hypothetical protein
MDHLLHELPEETARETQAAMESRLSQSPASTTSDAEEAPREQTPLLERPQRHFGHVSNPPTNEALSFSNTHRADSDISEPDNVEDPTKPLAGLNALEIAAVASAKKFLSQRLVQRVVQDIWDGDIIFWESLSVNAVKKARVYNKR